MRTGLKRLIVPLAIGAALTAALAAAGFAVQSVLRTPTLQDITDSGVLAELDRIATVRTIEQLGHGRHVVASCAAQNQRLDTLQIGARTLVVTLTKDGRIHLVAPRLNRTRLDGVEADLAVCPAPLGNELARRLENNRELGVLQTSWLGRRALSVHLTHRPAVIQLLVDQRTLDPLGVVLHNGRMTGTSRVTSIVFQKTSGAQPSAAYFLHLAQAGLVAARRAWWNSKLGWYDDKLVPTNHSMPLAYLWSAFPLFEAYDAVALADPTKANRKRLATFANDAERYWNGELQPVGGYSYYPGFRGPHLRTYFDDNGWWGIAFVDTYQATGIRRYLTDAARALHFIATSGWDPHGGGTWWDTGHGHTTSEPLAAAAYIAAALYRAEHRTSYLNEAVRLNAWADRHLRDPVTGLYGRNPTDPTAMDYVQGMMIGVKLELCAATGHAAYCHQADQVGSDSLRVFSNNLDWSATADTLYLRFLLALYNRDGQAQWYDAAYANAVHAHAHAATPDGLYLRSWKGEPVPAGRLRTHAGTVALFAWLATAVPPPHVRDTRRDPAPPAAPVTTRKKWPHAGTTTIERIEYRTHDGTLRQAWLLLPLRYRDKPIPLVISVHGRGVTAFSDALNWGNLPGEGGFAVICPAGQGRKLRFYSWGYAGQIDDLARMPRIAREHHVDVERGRIYAFGGSMGGQETLLLVAHDPHLLAGAVVFDPATNMSLRYKDFAALRDGRWLRREARVEIGGTPRSSPRAYALRSPQHYARQIAGSRVPIQLYWSTADRVISDQFDETRVLVKDIHAVNRHAPLLVFRGRWQHSAEMTPYRRLPAALARFGLLPWRLGFPTWIPHRTSGVDWSR